MSAAADDVRVAEARRRLESHPARHRARRPRPGRARRVGREDARRRPAARRLRPRPRETCQAAEDTRRLDRVRVVLAKFDWEHDDRQLALEAIERIVD